nr:hypothetical protein CJLB15_00074 [Campylobacter phage CJLB-15]
MTVTGLIRLESGQRFKTADYEGNKLFLNGKLIGKDLTGEIELYMIINLYIANI